MSKSILKMAFIAGLLTSSLSYAQPLKVIKSHQLFLGQVPECNSGYLHTGRIYMKGSSKFPRGCRADLYVMTLDSSSFDDRREYVELFVGITPEVNAGIVTTDRRMRGGATTAIGVLSKDPFPGDIELYVVTDDCKVNGKILGLKSVVTPVPSFNNCPNIETIGYASVVN